jgi:hypothetical protein
MSNAMDALDELIADREDEIIKRQDELETLRKARAIMAGTPSVPVEIVVDAPKPRRTLKVAADTKTATEGRRARIAEAVGKGQKRCPGCETVKSRSEFAKNSNAPSGLQSRCKACAREASRQRYAAEKGEPVKATRPRKEDEEPDPVPLAVDGRKICAKCLREKPVEDYSPGPSSDGLHSYCKGCRAAYGRDCTAQRAAVREHRRAELAQATPAIAAAPPPARPTLVPNGRDGKVRYRPEVDGRTNRSELAARARRMLRCQLPSVEIPSVVCGGMVWSHRAHEHLVDVHHVAGVSDFDALKHFGPVSPAAEDEERVAS